MSALHVVHEVAPDEDRVPAAQVVQEEPERYCPAEHAMDVQELAPAADDVPTGQEVQEEAPELL